MTNILFKSNLRYYCYKYCATGVNSDSKNIDDA